MSTQQVIRVFLSLIVIPVIIIAVSHILELVNDKPGTNRSNKLAHIPLYGLQMSPERTKILQFYADRLAEVNERYRKEMAKLTEEERETVRSQDSLIRQKRRGLSDMDVKFKRDRISSKIERIRTARREAFEDYKRDIDYFNKRRVNDLEQLGEKLVRQNKHVQLRDNSLVATDTAKSLPKKLQPRGLVTGVVFGDKPFAIVNDEIMRPGQTIDGIKILNISKDSGVEFEKNGKRWTQMVGDKPNKSWEKTLNDKINEYVNKLAEKIITIGEKISK